MRWLALVLISTLGLASLAAKLDAEVTATQEITRYVEDWAKHLPKSRRRALKHVASVAHWSTEYGVDPLLVAVVVSLESSWKASATGARGEVGLMQVHAPDAKRGFDLTDPDEQVHAGARWLRISIDACGGDVIQGIDMYATGECRSGWSKLAYRVKRWKRAVRLFRTTADSKSVDGGVDPHQGTDTETGMSIATDKPQGARDAPESR